MIVLWRAHVAKHWYVIVSCTLARSSLIKHLLQPLAGLITIHIHILQLKMERVPEKKNAGIIVTNLLERTDN